MLFPAIKRWCCRLQPQHLQLWRNGELHDQCRWQPQQPLAAQLTPLFASLPPAPAWRDSLEFVVDTPHVNYLLVPWSAGITRPAELRQYAALLLAQQQDEAQPMAVSFMRSGYGDNAFAALLPQALLAELKQTAAAQRLRLVGCCTPFSGMLAGFGRQLPENALFACAGTPQSSFACRYQRQWHSVFTLHLPHSELAQQLDTANRLAGLPPLARFVMHNQPQTPPGMPAVREATP
ncbi:hypothetical protein [Pantoea sp. B65]|uniref:hypothetical protein n=1 Tax=Pantoea sp. B65 TaxID=2813359 RepID=UPI0039B5C3AA